MYPINFAVFGMICVGLAAGFAFAVPQVLRLWPWSDGPLSYLFIASILAAFASGSLLVAWSRDWRAAAGGGIALAVGFGAMAVAMSVAPGRRMPHLRYTSSDLPWSQSLVRRYSCGPFGFRAPTRARRRCSPRLPPRCFLASCSSWASRSRPECRTSFHGRSSLPHRLFGLTFIGLSLNYYYVLARGRWGDAQVSLLGFLAYDLVLIGPFLRHFANVGDAHRLSLIVYTSALVYSALLAAYYLFLDRKWRLGMGGRAVSSDA